MKEIDVFEVELHFSQLLMRVMQGESIAITKHSRKVAILIPVAEKPTQNYPIAEAIERIRILRKGLKLGKKLTIKKLKKSGRK